MKKKIKLPLALGHTIECFDNTLYGFFAILLAPIFFPSDSETVSRIASFGAFLVGFLARPIGAVLFGFIGDRVGRKYALYFSVLCVGFPTLFIGLVPTYASIGVFAPILLIFLRFLQGLLWGGEFAGANIYVSEDGDTSLGARGGLLIFLGIMGAVAASLLGAFFTQASMPQWAWRIPFIIGGCLAFLTYFFRRGLMETEAFLESQRPTQTMPIVALLKEHKTLMLMTIFLSGVDLMPMYFATFFCNTFYQSIGFSTTDCMIQNSLCFFSIAIFCVVFGRLADKVSLSKQVKWGLCFLSFFSIPLYTIISGAHVTLAHVVVFSFLFSSLPALLSSIYMQYLVRFFPVHCRYSGVAIGVTLGQAIFGGTAPLVGTLLTEAFGTMVACGFFISIVSVIALALVKFNERLYAKREMMPAQVLEKNARAA